MKKIFDFTLTSALRISDYINTLIKNTKIKITQYQLHIIYLLMAIILILGLTAMLSNNTSNLLLTIYCIILFLNLLFVSAAIYAFENNIKVIKTEGIWITTKIVGTENLNNHKNLDKPTIELNVSSENNQEKEKIQKMIEFIKKHNYFRSDNLDTDLKNLLELNFYKIKKYSIHATYSSPIVTGRILFQLYDLNYFTEEQLKEVYKSEKIAIRGTKLKGNYSDHKFKLITKNNLYSNDLVNIPKN